MARTEPAPAYHHGRPCWALLLRQQWQFYHNRLSEHFALLYLNGQTFFSESPVQIPWTALLFFKSSIYCGVSLTYVVLIYTLHSCYILLNCLPSRDLPPIVNLF